MSLQLNRLLDNPAAKPFNSLVNLVDLASTAGQMFVVAPEDIKSEVYLFDTRGEERATLESEITDNWVEDNKTMQDHIGLKPIIITLSGYVGELTNKLPKGTPEELAQVPNMLSGISAFAPQLTTQAQYILNRAQEVYGVYEKANRTVQRIEDKLGLIELPEDVPNQQKVFDKFYEIWEKRGLSTVYTPFGVFDNMAIMSLNARQDEESTFISEFRVTFKKIRIAGQAWTYNSPELAKTAKQTLTKQVDKGIKMPSNKSQLLELASDPMGWAKSIFSGLPRL